MSQNILEHKEEALLALETLHKAKESDIPEILTEYMQFVAHTGIILFPWTLVRGLLEEKMKRVLTEMNTATAKLLPPGSDFNYKDTSSETINQLNQMQNAPFTIQRLCELLLEPTKYNNRIDKYLRSIRKVVFVGTASNFYTQNDLSAISAKDDVVMAMDENHIKEESMVSYPRREIECEMETTEVSTKMPIFTAMTSIAKVASFAAVVAGTVAVISADQVVPLASNIIDPVATSSAHIAIAHPIASGGEPIASVEPIAPVEPVITSLSNLTTTAVTNPSSVSIIESIEGEPVAATTTVTVTPTAAVSVDSVAIPSVIPVVFSTAIKDIAGTKSPEHYEDPDADVEMEDVTDNEKSNPTQ